jgi:anti-sigma B factor antagonist
MRRKSVAITESTTTPDLSIRVIDSDGDARVCVRGRLSIDSSPDLRDQLLKILDRQSLPALTIDLADLTYMDCSGIATLVEALKIAHARNTELLLKGLHDRPRYLLEVTGLLYLFETKGRTNGSSVPKAS